MDALYPNFFRRHQQGARPSRPEAKSTKLDGSGIGDGLDPNLVNAHQWYAYLLMATGRPDEAMREIKRAHELNPVSTIVQPTWPSCSLRIATIAARKQRHERPSA